MFKSLAVVSFSPTLPKILGISCGIVCQLAEAGGIIEENS
jgi:hypothetical protein